MLLCKRRAAAPPATSSAVFDVEGSSHESGAVTENGTAPPSMIPTSYLSAPPLPPPVPTHHSLAPKTAMPIAAPTTANTIASPFSSAPPLVPANHSTASITATPMVPPAPASTISCPFPNASAVASQPMVPGSPSTTSHTGVSAESGNHLAQASAPQGPCRIDRFQAAFDPLLERAVALHNDPAGKEGVRKGVRELYHKLGAGELQGSVLEKLARFVAAIEARDNTAANQVREQIVRTTTTGWVEGGTWQWCLKHLIEAAKLEEPTEAQGARQDASGYSVASGHELSPEITHVITTLLSRLNEARSSMDARKADDIAKRLDGLCEALRNGFINAHTCSQLCAVVQAAEKKDNAAAQRCFQEIAKNDFESSKTWLTALKQLLR